MKPWERYQPALEPEQSGPWTRYAQEKPAAPVERPYNATDDMSAWERGKAGFGKALYDIGRGVGQRVGLVSEEEVAEARERDKALMDTGAGTVGNVAGNMAALLPALAVPGANTVTGAAVIGGLSGAARPTVKGESVAKNIVTDAALGGVSQYGLGKGAEYFGRRLDALRDAGTKAQAANSVRDTAIQEAQEMGYKTIPSLSGGGRVGRTIEGLTGKEKAAQMASVKNQPITDSIVRRNFGLPDDAPLTRETMRTIRQKAVAEGYDPVRALPLVETDDAFRASLSKLTSRSDNAAKDFGALVESDVKPLVEGLSQVKAFSGDTAVDAISIFREKSSDLYASGNKSLGAAYRKAADTIEEQVERALTANGEDGAALLKGYRNARTKIAQTGDVEKALREGQGTVDARVLGKLFEKAPERMSGDIAKIGRTAAAMKDVMGVPKAGWANSVTALDSGVGTIGSIMAGNPLPLAYPVARTAGRVGLMSDRGQRMLTTPKYGPGPVDRNAPVLLEALRRRAAGAAVGPGFVDSEQE